MTALFIVAVAVGCGTARQPPVVDAPDRASFQDVARAYRVAPGYRDSGTYESRVGDFVFASSFETLFVRGVGFRLRTASPQRGSETYWFVDGTFAEEASSEGSEWHLSQATEGDLVRVLCGLRGTTDYASTVAPAMLLEFSFAKRPLNARVLEPSCPRCRSFGLQPNPVESIRVDTIDGLLVQWQVTTTVRVEPSISTLRFRPRMLSSQLDLENAAKELRAVPWSAKPR